MGGSTEAYRDVWKVDDDLRRVASDIMPRHLRQLVDGFCRPLIDIIDITERQLGDVEKNLKELSQQTRAAYDKLTRERRMDQEFVLYARQMILCRGNRLYCVAPHYANQSSIEVRPSLLIA